MKSGDIADIRREFGSLSLNETDAADDPIVQFEKWFAEIVQTDIIDPTAMVLSTVDSEGNPDSRVVLLKGIKEGGFCFYTNFESVKGQQLATNPHAAINFYWPQLARQVRVRGTVSKLSDADASDYFSHRPFKSQLSAIISPQSQIIANRRVLEDKIKQFSTDTQLTRPKYWGGYLLKPKEIEFWQGRDNRLHDRIHYRPLQNLWQKVRLAP